MSARGCRRQGGFTLIEAMIVIAVMVAAAGVAAAWWYSEAKRQVRADVIGRQALEIAQLARAVEQYLRTSPATVPSDGTAVEVTLDVLIGAGYLPNYFATQACCGMGYSPIGQRYRVYAARQSGAYRAVIVTSGAPSSAWLHRYGVVESDEGITGFQLAVMHKLRSERFLAAGIAKTGQRQVDVMLSGFNQPLSSFLPADMVAPSLVALVGFPEHSPTPPIVVTAPGGGGGTNNGPPMYVGCYLAKNATCASGYTEQWSHRLCDTWGIDNDHLPTNEYVNTAIGQVAIRRLVQMPCNTPTPGNRNSIAYLETCGSNGLDWPSMYQAAQNWNVGSPTGAMITTSSEVCGTQTYTNVRWDEYNLRCDADGRTARDYYWSTCGKWMYGIGGSACASAYYYPHSNAMYAGGLTEAVRGWPAIARGNVRTSTARLITGSGRLNDPIVRTLAVCPGSVNTSPVTVRRRVADGGVYEYMELYRGSFVERVEAGSDVFTATCETHDVIRGGETTTVMGQTISSACPSVSYPSPNGGLRRGYEPYRVQIANSDKPVVRVCCKSN